MGKLGNYVVRRKKRNSRGEGQMNGSTVISGPGQKDR
jgi:hypothetical protein